MRLIDADALKRKSQKVATEAWKLRIKATVEVILNQFIDYIDAAPTIKPEPQWIPCSERLPEDEDYHECMDCLDGAVWYCTDKGLIGLGYYYSSTKQWSTINDLKPDGKVIAWMPLPEPYEEGQDESI